MRILGIDPGYAIVGYGVVDREGMNYRPVEYGAVTTDAGTLFEERLRIVFEGICEIIDRTKPDAISICLNCWGLCGSA